MKKFFVLAATALFIMTSCSGDDAGNLINSNLIVPKKIITNGDTQLLHYDDENRLLQITEDNGSHSDYTYIDNNITEIEIYNSANNLHLKQLYEYSADKLVKHYEYNYYASTPEVRRKDFQYNPDGTITYTEYLGNEIEQNLSVGTTVLEIEEGNIVTATRVHNGSTYLTIYTYDNKNSLTKNIKGFEKLISEGGGTKNNLLSIKQFTNGVLENDNVYAYTYTTDNFPDSSTFTYNGELIFASQYIYE